MHSLRGRLTVGLTIVLAGVLFAAGVAIDRTVDRDEREALDDRLERTAELSRATAVAAVQEEVPAGDRRLDAVLLATRTGLRLTLGRSVLLETGDLVARGRSLPLGFSTFRRAGVPYRAYATTLRDPSLGGLARLELTTRLSAVEGRQRELRERLTLLGGIALAIAALAVFVTTSLVLSPLRRLRAVTASVAGDEDLARRVPADAGPSELRELAHSFNAMLARLGASAQDRERALAATRRFAADAGHELRTPLTSAQATLSTLARHPDLPSERRVEMARDALESQRRLVTLLDGLQALARGDAAAPHEPVDLAELAGDALAEVAERHPAVSWDADIDAGPVVVEGWAPGLRSLIENLLENAARHGRPGGRIRYTLARDPVALTVEDDGPGIPESERATIFEPFRRGAAGSGPGSGLGLAIVAQQARHHGAAVDVGTSTALGGARFVVRFEG